MNRKQKRLERRLRKTKNWENYLHNRRHWCLKGGPLVVMDEPTEEHVKALLMSWLAPRRVLDDVANEMSAQMTKRIDQRMEKVLTDLLTQGMTVQDQMHAVVDLGGLSVSELWTRIARDPV